MWKPVWNGVQYTLSGCNLLTDTGVNDNVRIHSHTDTEDDTCDTRKGQGDIKSIQCYQHQCGVHQKSDTWQPDPESDIPDIMNRINDDQTDGACVQAGVRWPSVPSCAPTTLERSSSSSREREPIRMEEASFSASLMACHTADDCACRL